MYFFFSTCSKAQVDQTPTCDASLGFSETQLSLVAVWSTCGCPKSKQRGKIDQKQA